jgi:hypothetical protein
MWVRSEILLRIKQTQLFSAKFRFHSKSKLIEAAWRWWRDVANKGNLSVCLVLFNPATYVSKATRYNLCLVSPQHEGNGTYLKTLSKANADPYLLSILLRVRWDSQPMKCVEQCSRFSTL